MSAGNVLLVTISVKRDFLLNMAKLSDEGQERVVRSMEFVVWGRRIQAVSTGLIFLVGAALIYASPNPGLFDRLVLPS